MLIDVYVVDVVASSVDVVVVVCYVDRHVGCRIDRRIVRRVVRGT